MLRVRAVRVRIHVLHMRVAHARCEGVPRNALAMLCSPLSAHQSFLTLIQGVNTGDGLLRYEGYELLYLIMKKGYVTLELVNELIAEIPDDKSGVKVPALHDSVKTGGLGGVFQF